MPRRGRCAGWAREGRVTGEVDVERRGGAREGEGVCAGKLNQESVTARVHARSGQDATISHKRVFSFVQ